MILETLRLLGFLNGIRFDLSLQPWLVPLIKGHPTPFKIQLSTKHLNDRSKLSLISEIYDLSSGELNGKETTRWIVTNVNS